MGGKNKIGDNLPDWQVRFFAYSVTMADMIRSYLAKKKMTTDDMSEKVGFTKTKAKQMLSGHYNFDIEEMTKLELMFNGHYDTYEKMLLIEKKSRKEDSSL
jgi:hypothetical protein